MFTRIQDRSVDEIAARASQYLEGESGAEEFRERLLRTIAHADEDALIFLAKAIADNAEEMDQETAHAGLGPHSPDDALILATRAAIQI